MNADELFIDGNNLPKPLSKQEVYELLDKIKQGDEHAMSKLVEHNIRLVLSEVMGRFNDVQYDKKDLVSIGNVGLMKAITTFDTSKKVEFSTYAIRCIDNEILMFLRKFKKYAKEDSLDRSINCNNDGDELIIEDTISDDTDILRDYTNNETYFMIRKIVNDLPECDREIIMLYFGFYNDEIHTQKEIAEMLSLSRSYVSRLISKIVKKIGVQLAENGLIELRRKQSLSNNVLGNKKSSRRLKTIYEYFDLYTKEQVDLVIEKLSDEDRKLIKLRYGENLNEPISGKLNQEEYRKFYGSLIPKIKRLLKNPNKEIKTRKKRRNDTGRESVELVDQTQNERTLVRTKDEIVIEPIISSEGNVVMQSDLEMILSSLNIMSLSKENCNKILGLLQDLNFIKNIGIYSQKELMIASLKLGYVDGKCFSTEAISEFFGVDQQEVIDITRKVLFTYKELINQIIDNMIENITEGNEKLLSLKKTK